MLDRKMQRSRVDKKKPVHAMMLGMRRQAREVVLTKEETGKAAQRVCLTKEQQWWSVRLSQHQTYASIVNTLPLAILYASIKDSRKDLCQRLESSGLRIDVIPEYPNIGKAFHLRNRSQGQTRSLRFGTMASDLTPIRLLLNERRHPSVRRTESCKISRLMALPLELRMQIYEYLLPYTETVWTIYGKRATVWRQGSIALLTLSRQIGAEAADVMYGNASFVVEVDFDNIVFRPRIMCKSGTMSPKTPPFLETVKAGNMKRVRRLAISIQHVDSYLGMIKYNFGGDGLTEGLRKQVQTLVDAISCATELRIIRVHMAGGNTDPKAAQRVLEPFAKLENITGEVIVDGGATLPFHSGLEAAMKVKAQMVLAIP